MSASAQICYNSKKSKVNLQIVKDLIEKETEWKAVDVEWRGYGLVIPQILVCSPLPFTIQLEDDPEWVPEEIQEFGHMAKIKESDEILEQLAECDAMLSISSIEQDQIIENSHSINVSTINTAINPSHPEVAKIIYIIGSSIDGILFDCVNGKLTTCSKVQS